MLLNTSMSYVSHEVVQLPKEKSDFSNYNYNYNLLKVDVSYWPELFCFLSCF